MDLEETEARIGCDGKAKQEFNQLSDMYQFNAAMV
jgi:hypothetical protein